MHNQTLSDYIFSIRLLLITLFLTALGYFVIFQLEIIWLGLISFGMGCGLFGSMIGESLDRKICQNWIKENIKSTEE